MKKICLVLLSLSMVAVFSVSAYAVDVKVGAEYYAAGLYLNKIYLDDGKGSSQYTNPSTAFFFQRLRVGTDFVVSPSLKLVTRFDALERIWGGARSEPTSDYNSWESAGTRFENENIAFDVAYIDYSSPIGRFQVGYMPDLVWGTVFDDWSNHVAGQIKYTRPVGPFTLVAIYAKEWENGYNYVTSSYAEDTDVDADSYRIGGIYNINSGKVRGEAGILFSFDRDATDKTDGYPDGRLRRAYSLQPYFKVKVASVDLQGEVAYVFGDDKYEDNSPNTDVTISAINVFLDATANLGMFYVGGSFAYLSGDDPNTSDKLEGVYGAGLDWNPCLIMFNNDIIGYWVGGLYGFGPTSITGPMSNAWFFQGRTGVKPTPQWDVMLSVSYAKADKALMTGNGPTPDFDYGTEIDLVGTYKITNNLNYMLGAGYLFTGGLLKGCGGTPGSENRIVDDFMFINKLTLTF